MKVKVTYLGPSAARVIPGVGTVKRGESIEVDEEFASGVCDKLPRRWKRESKVAPMAQAKKDAKAPAAKKAGGGSPSLN
jgi:hypothetical protein